MRLSPRDQARIHALRADPASYRTTLSALMKEHQGLVKKALKTHRLSLVELEEIYQDTIMVFVEKVYRDQFREESSISTFIGGIFFRKIANTLREKGTIKRGSQEKVVHELKEQMAVTPPDVLKNYDAEDARQRADYYLGLLDAKCKEMLVLAIYREFDMEEIADRLGLKNARGASAKKHSCLKRLKAIIEERENGD